ncbi:MAG: hypothetical protein IPO66_07095 [Rhodanobacteraceae bacterium]|nr:hypothetical protein [Rhodanobacteraceae bacterium]
MRWMVYLVSLLVTSLPMPLVAASFCVSNSAELQAAIETAASNADSNDTIRLRPGVYPSPPPNGFRETFPHGDNISISGGWLPLIGQCDLPGYDATASVIDGEEQRAGLVFHRNGVGSGETHLSWLTIRGGRQNLSSLFYGNGGGVAIHDSGPASIQHMIFENNRATVNGGALYLAGAQRTVRNNLFVDNWAANGSAVFAPGAGGTVLFSNNTLTRNGFVSPSGLVFLVDFSTSPASFAWNNIFHNNPIFSGYCDISGDQHMLNNNIIEHPCGSYAAGSSNNVNVDPRFAHPLNDLRLRRDSPAIDAGLNSGVSARDLDGRPRQIGPAVDRGAYEADFLFGNGFE